MEQTAEHPSLKTEDRDDRWLHWGGAIFSLVLLLFMLGTPPVQRTQEARVLEVAREMVGAPLQDWLIPHINGEIRVQKPPLAYWLAAIAFQIGGVSEGVGRLPFALTGWGILVLTYFIARWLFGSRAGLLAAGMLASTLMFAHFARLAETDILATLFVTAAIACIWRGWPNANGRATKEWASFALSGAMIGMAAFAKGLPALFVFIYLIAQTVVMRDWRALWRWCKSGAPLFALLTGAPWYAYIFVKVGIKTFADETRIGLLGEEHTGGLFNYGPDLLRAVAPWTALTVIGIVVAAFMWRRDARLRGLILWTAAVIVPLCFGGQRQYHYLLPAMPPLAILTGWVLDESLTRRLAHWKLADGLMMTMFVVMLLGAISFPIIGYEVRPGLTREDIVAAVSLGIAAAIGIWACLRTNERTGIIAVALTGFAATIFTQSWLPSLQTDNSRAVAQQVRTLAPGPVCFYGENISIPLIFNLQRKIPRYMNPEELSVASDKEPAMVVVAQTKANHVPPPLPGNFEAIGKIVSDEQVMNLYRRKN